MRRLRLLFLFLAVVLGLPLVVPALAQPVSPPRPICFPELPAISSCVDPAFAAYWQSNGGLPVFGYPIAPVEQSQPAGATAPLTVQWFERNRLEQHPQNQPAYRVLLGRMGAERLAQLGRNPAAEFVEEGPQAGCLWFAQTKHNVCDQGAGEGFKRYWERNGLQVAGLSAYDRSLALFGLPLTAAQPEPGANGELIITQWFERARFEWHPDQAAPYRVLLGLLGNELRAAQPAQPAQPAQLAGPSVFGAEIQRGSVEAVALRVGLAQLGWVRYNGVLWPEVEPKKGDRNWVALGGVEAELAAISRQGAQTLLIVRGTPSWARQYPDKQCGPIRADALDEFAAFVGELVARYSRPPYNVKYWELGNEPDAAASLVGGEAGYGCWGDESRADYGGAGYAAMLKAVYPVIKAADPEAQVVLGGLLLDCDPTLLNQPRPCKSGNFFDGVLRAGGGDAFDIVAYHSYIYWGPVTLDWDVLFPPWAHRGGALLGKLSLLRELMARYNLNKPVIMNEGGLLCYRSSPDCATGSFYRDQANYVARLYTRAWATGLLGAVWYTLDGPGWQEGGLLDTNQEPRPAYVTLRFLSTTLAGTQLIERIVDGALERSTFRKGDLQYEIVWTNDGTTVQLALPSGSPEVYNIRGERLGGVSSPLTIGFEPLIIVTPVGP